MKRHHNSNLLNYKIYFKKVLCHIIFIFGIISFSQNRVIADSLLYELEHRKLSDDQRINKLRQIGFRHPDLNKALESVQQSLELSRKVGSRKLEVKALGVYSSVQRRLGNTVESLQASLEALKIYDEIKDIGGQASAYNQIASTYLVDEEYLLAIEYFQKAKDIYVSSDKYGNLLLTILNLGEAYRLAGYLDLAENTFKELLNQKNTSRMDRFRPFALGNIGMVYSTQKRFELAKENLNKAIDYFLKTENYSPVSVYIAELGEVYRKEGKYKLAEQKYLEAIEIAQREGLKEQIRDFSEMLTQLYEKTKKYQKALAYQKLYQIYQDSLVNKANIKKFEQQKAGYEIDKKKSEIGLLNIQNTNQRRWVIGLGVGLSLLLLLSYLLFRGRNKIKKANTELSHQKEIITKKEKEKAWLLRELNHRVKNNLQMISSLLNLQSSQLEGHPAQEAIITGKNRVEALSLVHQKLYQEGVDTRIHVKEYIKELVLGLCHGYNANFEPEFDIAETSVSIDIAIPLALIVNEMVINCLKYAYEGVETPSLVIRIKPVENEDRLDIEIQDNGVGFTKDISEKSNSLGIKIINSLIQQLEGNIERLEGDGTHWKMNIKAT